MSRVGVVDDVELFTRGIIGRAVVVNIGGGSHTSTSVHPTGEAVREVTVDDGVDAGCAR